VTKSLPIPMSPGLARTLSVMVAVGLTIGYLLQAAVPDGSDFLFGIEMLFKLGGLIASVFLFLSVYGQNANAQARCLDERQRAERNLAYLATHQILVATLLGVSFYGLFAVPLGWWLPRAADAVDMMMALAIGAMALPAAILAWRDRDMPDED
jgi:hypothetical protein